MQACRLQMKMQKAYKTMGFVLMVGFI